jgi:vacuolar-type H+-ATPase subunit I/STV1
VVVAWLSLTGLLVTLFIAFIYPSHERVILNQYSPFWIITLVTSGFCYTAICPFLKCESCGRSITVQWTRKNPPFSKRMLGLYGWPSIVLQVLLTEHFICMYCGKKYSIK